MPRKMVGVVVSTAMDRTATVQIERMHLVSKLRKVVRRRSRILAHDQHNICALGDRVEIVPCRKMSRKKAHAVVAMVRRHPQVGGEPFEPARLENPPPVEVDTPEAAAAAVEELGLDVPAEDVRDMFAR
mmetsp:Transcript_7791/g.18542  ORF Transcript_7791/g.18542 Transcript_7791/m.18542 type:complete len:129 (-) Transcript_7791:144-530(-)